jgi:hypothetical protein
MVLFLIACIAVLMSAVISEVRRRARFVPANLGWMSEQWLAECRASQSK